MSSKEGGETDLSIVNAGASVEIEDRRSNSRSDDVRVALELKEETDKKEEGDRSLNDRISLALRTM